MSGKRSRRRCGAPRRSRSRRAGRCASPRKRPCSTTPARRDELVRQPLRVCDRGERAVEDPVALVGDEHVVVRRRAARSPRARGRRGTPLPASTANCTTSTGNAALLPSTGESFASSTTITSRRLACATIFSCSSAPPPPLIRLSSGSTSSAPSIVRSMTGCSASVVSGMPTSRASCLARRRRRDAERCSVSSPDCDQLADPPDREHRGAPGAEPDDHAGLDPVDRPLAGGLLQLVAVSSRARGHDRIVPAAGRRDHAVGLLGSPRAAWGTGGQRGGG